MRHSTGKPTQAERARLDVIHLMPCIACEGQWQPQPYPTEAHHLVDRGTREHSGCHAATLPLCAWHHRGICVDVLTASEMTRRYGPSLARHKRAFIERYGSERELLARVDARLSGCATRKWQGPGEPKDAA